EGHWPGASTDRSVTLHSGCDTVGGARCAVVWSGTMQSDLPMIGELGNAGGSGAITLSPLNFYRALHEIEDMHEALDVLGIDVAEMAREEAEASVDGWTAAWGPGEGAATAPAEGDESAAEEPSAGVGGGVHCPERARAVFGHTPWLTELRARA